MKTCILWHRWGKWSLYGITRHMHYPEWNKSGVTHETRQRRRCEVCGKTEDEHVSDSMLKQEAS